MADAKRKGRTADQLDDIFNSWIALHPDCTGITMIGGVFRLEPKGSGAPSWSHACACTGRYREPTRCEAALVALLSHLQRKYDLVSGPE